MEKFPEPLKVSASTSPSVSVAVTAEPFKVSAVLAIPDCVEPILSVSAEPLILKKLSKLDPIELRAIDDDAPFVTEVIL